MSYDFSGAFQTDSQIARGEPLTPEQRLTRLDRMLTMREFNRTYGEVVPGNPQDLPPRGVPPRTAGGADPGSTVGDAGPEQDLLGAIAQATVAYRDLQATVLARAERDLNGPIPLSPAELNVLFEYEYFTTLAQPRPRNLFGNEGLLAQYAGYDTFLRSPRLSARQFIIGGQSYEGGHINYIAVGMLAAHHGPNGYGSIPQLVTLHNAAQMAGFRGGGGARNYKHIAPGTKWALIGANYYKAKSRRRPQ